MLEVAGSSTADDASATPTVRDRPGLRTWKVVFGLTLASAFCTYFWVTRELTLSSWLTSRLLQCRYLRSMTHPLYFQEWTPPEGSEAEMMQARRKRLENFAKMGGSINSVDKIEVQDVNLPVRGGEIHLRISTPLNLPSEGIGNGDGRAVVIFLQGGGWMLGTIDTPDGLTRDIAIETGVMVVTVAHRLAPEFKFPVPVRDTMAAVRWVRRNIHLFGGDKKRIALAGESAGGNIALATALYLGRWWWPFGEGFARKQLCAIVSVSPPVSFQHAQVGKGEDDGEWRSYRRYWEGYGLVGDQMKSFWDHYLGDPNNGRHPMASPLRASRSQLRRLPPVLLIRSDHEVLWDEIAELGKVMADAGVEVEEFQSQRCIHGMYARPTGACGILPLRATGQFLKAHCS